MLPVPLRGSHCARARSSTAGIRNESVLPDPVLACASTSCPRSNGGIERAWISVSVSNFMSAIAACVSGSRSSDENCTPMNDSGGSSSASAALASASATRASADWRSASAADCSMAIVLSFDPPPSFIFFFFFLSAFVMAASAPASEAAGSPTSSPAPPGLRECFRLRFFGPSGATPSEALTSGT